ncbi:MAG: ABC transporter permease [Chloroflexota bacterium]|nr:ABC transporter permease [Chloroflexota bacterium]
MVADLLPRRVDHSPPSPGSDRAVVVDTKRAPQRRLKRGQQPSWLTLLPLTVFLVLALLGPLAIAASPVEQSLVNRLAPPLFFGGDWEHPLGTDGLGRDLLIRIAVAARLSLLIGLVATAITAAVGVTLGLLAGVIGGAVDRAISALVDIQLAVPYVVVGIAVAATLGQSVGTVVIVLVLTGWVTFARVVRVQARVVRQSAYIQAAVVLGASRSRVMLRHILPNVLPAILVLASQSVGAVMLYEASLTYLGVGLPVERITLGGLVAEGQDLIFQAWWVTGLPGLAVALAIVGFNLLGDVLQHHGGRR